MTAKSESTKGRTLQDFRAVHDKSFIIPLKIKEGLKELGQSWEYEQEFLRRIDVCQNDISRFRDDFAENLVITKGKTPKKIWAGDKGLASKMQAMVNQHG